MWHWTQPLRESWKGAPRTTPRCQHQLKGRLSQSQSHSIPRKPVRGAFKNTARIGAVLNSGPYVETLSRKYVYTNCICIMYVYICICTSINIYLCTYMYTWIDKQMKKYTLNMLRIHGPRSTCAQLHLPVFFTAPFRHPRNLPAQRAWAGRLCQAGRPWEEICLRLQPKSGVPSMGPWFEPLPSFLFRWDPKCACDVPHAQCFWRGIDRNVRLRGLQTYMHLARSAVYVT